MSSSRVVRGTKGRIFLCICAILIITGIIACYNNTLSQLDDVRRANDQCHQQQENLSAQLQVIFDYRQRLEKSLKTEKAEHQQTKKDLENRLEEERARHEKTTNEVNLKFSSLQQHYNLLKTQYDDFKEESSKMQREQLDEINNLQLKLKEVQGQLKQSITDKENSFEHLKSQYLQLQVDKENLEKQFKGTQSSNFQSENEINHLTKVNHELQRELDELKAKYSISVQKTSSTKHSAPLTTNISKQADIGEPIYQIQDVNNNPVEPKLEPNNVVELPSNADEQGAAVKVEKFHDGFDNNENVLVPPNNANMQVLNQKSSTAKSISKGSLDAAQPLHIPTITPSSIKSNPSQESHMFNQDPHVLPLPYAQRKVPMGIVPVPDTPLEIGEESKGDVKKPEGDEKDIREDVNNAFPNRYRANLIQNELANEDKAIEADKREQNNEGNKEGRQNLLKSDVGDKENNALEVFDPPLNNNEKSLDGDPFGLDDGHHIDKASAKRSQQKQAKPHNLLGADGVKLDPQDGMDYDRDVQNDVQLEENDPEADDDDPEYADHIARQKDPAVRN